MPRRHPAQGQSSDAQKRGPARVQDQKEISSRSCPRRNLSHSCRLRICYRHLAHHFDPQAGMWKLAFLHPYSSGRARRASQAMPGEYFGRGSRRATTPAESRRQAGSERQNPPLSRGKAYFYVTEEAGSKGRRRDRCPPLGTTSPTRFSRALPASGEACNPRSQCSKP